MSDPHSPGSPSADCMFTPRGEHRADLVLPNLDVGEANRSLKGEDRSLVREMIVGDERMCVAMVADGHGGNA